MIVDHWHWTNCLWGYCGLSWGQAGMPLRGTVETSAAVLGPWAYNVGKIAALRKLLSQLPKHTDLSFDEHQCLAEAVRKGDLTEIKALLAEHIDRTRKAYKTATGLLQKSDH